MAPRAPLPASPSVRASILARLDGSEARIRESAILYGCLNHPAEAQRLESRLERQAFRCRDLAEIRDALLDALGASLDDHRDVAARVALRLGRDPLPGLRASGHVRANLHLGPSAAPDMAARALDEALGRYAALTGRADEIRDAAAELAEHPDEAITTRIRAAADAEQSADVRPLEDDHTEDRAEQAEFAEIITAAEAARTRRPAKP